MLYFGFDCDPTIPDLSHWSIQVPEKDLPVGSERKGKEKIYILPIRVINHNFSLALYLLPHRFHRDLNLAQISTLVGHRLDRR